MEFNIDDLVEVTTIDYVYSSYETMAMKLHLQLFECNKLPTVGNVYIIMSKDFHEDTAVVIYGVTDGINSFVIGGGSLKLVAPKPETIIIDIETNVDEAMVQVHRLREQVAACAKEWKALQELIREGL